MDAFLGVVIGGGDLNDAVANHLGAFKRGLGAAGDGVAKINNTIIYRLKQPIRLTMFDQKIGILFQESQHIITADGVRCVVIILIRSTHHGIFHGGMPSKNGP